MINTVVIFLREICQPFARAQAHRILNSILVIIEMVLEAAAFLHKNVNLELSLFLAVLEMAVKICLVPDKSRRRAYLASVFWNSSKSGSEISYRPTRFLFVVLCMKTQCHKSANSELKHIIIFRASFRS